MNKKVSIAQIELKNYYPLGMVMGQNIEGDYRYGYQGENAEEEELGATHSFEVRLWDARIGRWLSVDPLVGETGQAYIGMGNNPINLVDPDGRAADDIIFNSIDKNGNKTELGRIVTLAFKQEINIDQDVLPFDVTDNFEPVIVSLSDNEMVRKTLERTGIQAFSLDFSGEAALKLGLQGEVSLIGIVAGENKGDWGVSLQGNALVGIEASFTGSGSAYWPISDGDLSLNKLRGREYGVQGSVFGVAGSHFEGLNFISSYPFVEKVYGGASLGGSLDIPELAGSASDFIGFSDYIYKSKK